MNTASVSSFQPLAAPFLDPSEIKVWSVIVTIMGDLAPEGVVSGPVLTALVETMGLQAQAMRVALHRLKKDGWVDNDRVGRIGYYRLTDMARHSTDGVRDRVYGESLAKVTQCTLSVLAPEATFDAEAGGLEIAPRVVLSAAIASAQSLSTRIARSDIPDWALPAIEGAATVDAYQSLWADIEALLATLDLANLGPVERAALRIVVLHRWRRVVLRSSEFAETLLPADDVSVVCRKAFHLVLEALPRPSLDELGAAVGMV